LLNNTSVQAYQSASVAFGETCQAQSRTCSDGSLSGTYAFSACTVSAASSCSFNGQTVAHGDSVGAYESSSVLFGEICQSQTRVCNNGQLSGNYSHSSCVVSEFQIDLPSSIQFGSGLDDHPYSIALDEASNILVSAHFQSGTNNNSSAANILRKYTNGMDEIWTQSIEQEYNNYNSSGDLKISQSYIYTTGQLNYDAYLAKYEKSGVRQWIEFLRGGSDTGYGVALDDEGSSVMVGEAGYNIDGFEGIPFTSGTQHSDCFVAKYNPSGSRTWLSLVGSIGFSSEQSPGEHCSDVAVDSNKDVYVTGVTNGSISGQTSMFGRNRLFVVKVQSNGEIDWVSDNNENLGDGRGIMVDNDKNTYVTGGDFSLAKFNPAGELQWVKRDGFGNDITIDENDYLYVTGGTNGNVGDINQGGTDALLIKYDSTGARQWVRQFGSSSNDFGEAVVVDSAGNSYVLGKTESSVDGHENLGGSDVFIIKFDADGNR